MVVGGLTVALLILGAIAVSSTRGAAQQNEDMGSVVHTHQVLEQIDLLAVEIARARANHNAILVVGHADVEEGRLDINISLARETFRELHRLTSDNLEQQQRLDAYEPSLNAQLTALADTSLPDISPPSTLETRKQRDVISIAARSERIRGQLGAVRDAEQSLLVERERRSAVTAATTRQTIFIGNVAGIGILLLLFFAMLREDRLRRSTSEELERANTIVSAVISGIGDSIIVKDVDQRILLVNQAAAKAIGTTPSAAVGKRLDEFVNAAVAEKARLEDEKILRNNISPQYEQQLGTAERPATFRVSKFPLKDPAGKVSGVVSFSHDVTEERELVRQLAASNEQRGQMISELERRSASIMALSEMAGFLQSASTFAEAHKLIQHFATRLFPNIAGTLFVTVPSGNLVEPVATWGDRASGDPFAPLTCWALKTGKINVSSAGGGALCGHVARTDLPAQCIPLVAQAEALGVICLAGEAQTNTADAALVAAFAEQIALALANLRLRETLRIQATRDPLTGLFNRRYMDETLTRELSRAARKSASVSVIMIDIDHFKRFNDSEGHSAGDRVLQEVAVTLLKNVRREDVACRFGGEELAIIFPEMSISLAAERAEKLRADIEALRVQINNRSLGTITASFGVAVYPAHGISGAELIQKADSALYAAKKNGRNCVVICD
jgi:diguanylate cyclase (GGDEF)-like protein/PAS domain S-box-containing protein